MRILAVDVGAGTQDILLFDSRNTIENCYKLVLPSATVVIASKIRSATRAKRDIVLTGYTMGGGACGRALSEHLSAGLRAYATPLAAATFDDDLDVVREMGVTIVSDDESAVMSQAQMVVLRDLDLEAIRSALSNFAVEGSFDGVAVAVQDHGAAPPGVSDRVFRFEYLKNVISKAHDLFAFAYSAKEIPEFLTRMRSVAQSMVEDTPLLLLDTGPAAALGALEDGKVSNLKDVVVVNIGNGHTLAIRIVDNRIVSVFEHHTHLLTTDKLDVYIDKLISNKLTHEEIFDSGGHGCLLSQSSEGLTACPRVVVTGPRRGLMERSAIKPYLAAPHGDMMLSGSFGLVRAFAHKYTAWREEIEMRLI